MSRKKTIKVGTPVVQGCIYSLTNLINGKRYVGQHKNVLTVESIRWRSHVYAALRGSVKMYITRAIHYYGYENFVSKIIWRGPVSKLNEKETYYIKKLHTFIDDPLGDHSYNLTTGGEQLKEISKRTKARISAGQVRRYLDPIAHEKTRAAAILRYEDLAEREKTSMRNLQRFADPKEGAKISAGQLRRYKDSAAHEKSSQATKKVWAAMSAAERTARGSLTAQAWARMSDAKRIKRGKLMSIGLRAHYENPAEREKQRKIALLRFEDPAEHEKLRKGALLRFEDPAEHEKLRVAQNKPETKIKRGKSSKRVWDSRSAEERSAIALKGVATRVRNSIKKGIR